MSNNITRRGASQTLTCEQYSHGAYWTGAAEQLIRAGVCEAHQLPGAPGRNKTSVCIQREAFRITKLGKLFRVYKANAVMTQSAGFRRFLEASLQPVDIPPEVVPAAAAAPWPLTAVTPEEWANMPEQWHAYINRCARSVQRLFPKT